jgi:hypothetical protein
MLFLLSAALATPPPCTSDAIRAVRVLARADLDRGDPAAAVARLQGVTCDLYDPSAAAIAHELAWAYADLAYSLRAAGDPRACYALAGRQMGFEPGDVGAFLDEDDRALRALRVNEEACRRDIEAGWGAFVAEPCPGASDGVGVPGGPPACVRVGMEGTLPFGDACPTVALVTGGGTEATRSWTLTVPEGVPLSNPGVCCHVSTVRVQRHGDEVRLRIAGEGRDCGGGTALTEEVTVYAVQGDRLVYVDGYGAARH